MTKNIRRASAVGWVAEGNLATEKPGRAFLLFGDGGSPSAATQFSRLVRRRPRRGDHRIQPAAWERRR